MSMVIALTSEALFLYSIISMTRMEVYRKQDHKIDSRKYCIHGVHAC